MGLLSVFPLGYTTGRGMSTVADAPGGGGPAEAACGLVGTIAGPDLRGGFPPGPGRGIQAFSRESPDAKSRGGMPPPPIFYGPLAAARSFWRWVAQRGGRGAITVPMYVP